MKKKYMEMFSFVFLFSSFVAIVIKYWLHLRSKKNGNDQVQVQQVVEATNNNLTRKEKEDLKHTYDTVNAWLNNCDQKAGILLTVVGVAITVMMTSDFLKELRTYIFTPFVKYWTERTELIFSWSRFTVFVFLVIAVVMLIASCYYLFRTIWANIDYEKMREENPRLVKKSYIFWGSISGMTYDEFKQEEVDYNDDLKSQVYVNSKIAAAKFQNYNEGLFWFKFLLLVSVMLFIAVMFMK